jgi:dimethylaniline monooxygenase (N-oxide forming)
LKSFISSLNHFITKGCSNPKIPAEISQSAADKAQFRGIVLHSSQFATHLDKILEAVKPVSSNCGSDDSEIILVVGGGKSAQELVTFMCIHTSNTHEHLSMSSMATKLTLEGRKVAIVFETSDAFLASTSPTPAFIRKGRFVPS